MQQLEDGRRTVHSTSVDDDDRDSDADQRYNCTQYLTTPRIAC